jgi:hypothetical protein
MRRTLRLLACSLLAVSAASVASATSIYIDPLYGISVTSNVTYTMAATSNMGLVPLKLDIYQPTDIGLAPVLPTRPAIVIQDGGAWVSADKTNGRVTTIANYMTQRGYTVIVSDYRQGANDLFGAGGDVVPIVGQTPFGTQPYAGQSIPGIYQIFPGTNAIRAGIEDFAVAMAWARSNASSLGIDPNRIAAAGGSAGGIDNLMLQYNNNPVNPAYAAQAVIGLVSSLYGNEARVKPGGPPVFLLNNTQDVVVPWSPNMDAAFANAGIYYEQWFQPADPLYHNVEWDLDLGGLNLKERVRDFLAYHFSGGPIPIPEPSTLVLGLLAAVSLIVVRLRARAIR